MFGKSWEKAQGTVIASKPVKTSGDGSVTIYEFVVDVRTTSGEVFRAKVGEPRVATNFWRPRNGAVVGVEYDNKSRKVRFDKDDPTLSFKNFKAQQDGSFEATLAQQPGTSPGVGAMNSSAAAGLPPGVLPPQLQALIESAAANGNVARLDPNSAESIALRDMLLRSGGVVQPPPTTPTPPARHAPPDA